MTLEQAQQALAKHQHVYRSVLDAHNELYIESITGTIDNDNQSFFANLTDGTQRPLSALTTICPGQLDYESTQDKLYAELARLSQLSPSPNEMIVPDIERQRLSDAISRMQTRASIKLRNIPNERPESRDYELWHQQEVYRRKRLQKRVKKQAKRISELYDIKDSNDRIAFLNSMLTQEIDAIKTCFNKKVKEEVDKQVAEYMFRDAMTEQSKYQDAKKEIDSLKLEISKLRSIIARYKNNLP